MHFRWTGRIQFEISKKKIQHVAAIKLWSKLMWTDFVILSIMSEIDKQNQKQYHSLHILYTEYNS